MATRNSTQRKTEQAPRLAPVITRVSRTSNLSIDSADFISSRLGRAEAIASVLTRIFGGEYAGDVRPEDPDVLISLEHVGRLLHECNDHYQDVPRAPEADPWWEDIRDATALVKVMGALTWADEWKISFGDGVMADYLWAIKTAISQASSGLSIAMGEVEASHV